MQQQRHEGPSQDSQPITPGQRPRERSNTQLLSQARESMSWAAKTVLADELTVVERQAVAIAILQEKQGKLQAMVEGTREIPRELKATRSLPGLGPSYKFSAKVRLQAEEMCKEQDRKYVDMLLKDLTGKVIPDAFKDMEDILASCRKRIARKVEKAEYAEAELVFNEDSCHLIEKQDELLTVKRQPRKRKAPELQEEQRPNKRSRKEGKKSRHRRRHYKPKQN